MISDDDTDDSRSKTSDSIVVQAIQDPRPVIQYDSRFKTSNSIVSDNLI
jgi:hypothetical protein